MVHVVASIHVVSGQLDFLMNQFKLLVPKVLAEKGCVEYIPSIDMATEVSDQSTEADCLTVIEKWDSLDDLKAHLSAPHMDEFRQSVANALQSVTIKILKSV